MSQDDLYERAVTELGAALERLARSYEADGEKRRDLLQEIHLALWRSFATFSGQCSLRTWVYRVAHNVAATHVLKDRQARAFVTLEDIEVAAGANDTDALIDLYALIARLEPLEREVILLYLEGLDAAAIGEITGISAANVAVKIHRFKKRGASR
jgi:RNA polymerase sigma-70 factor (ECF subfamily)